MLETDRLLMRLWRPEDAKPFADLNADPVVMEYFPSTLNSEESAHWIVVQNQRIEDRGFGLWALEEKDTGAFVGFTGLSVPGFEAHFTPAVEVGWRLLRKYWGNGFATEAARRSVTFGFDEVGLDEIVSFTVPANTRSVAVMERLGMTRDPADDFEHPEIEESTGLRHLVLFRLRRNEWHEQRPNPG